MTKIICLSGKKQAGKNTACNYITGLVLRQEGIIRRFDIDETGQLWIPLNQDEDQHIDMLRKDKPFVVLANKLLWPHVKVYSFADEIKSICMKLFGFSYEQCYGTNEQKDSKTNLDWKNMPGYLAYCKELKLEKKEAPTGKMSSRDFMQYFGSNIMRRIFSDCWVEATLNNIAADEPKYALICDGRFPNEIEGTHTRKGHSIRLTRKVSDDSHISETALDGYTKYSALIDNQELSIAQTCQLVEASLKEWDWIK